MRGLLALACVGVVAAELGGAPAGAAELRWFGQACFEITSSTGTRVLIDPFNPQVGYPALDVTADVVLVTHEHGDHNNVAAVKGKPEVLHGLQIPPGSHPAKGLTIRSVRATHGEGRGEDTIFVLKVDGITFAHLGDLGKPLSAEQVREIGPVDVLMLPVGSVYTIDGTQAAQVAKALRPRLVVPMHYKTPALKIGLEGPEKFLDAAKAAGWTVERRARLTATRASLPKKTTVVLLDYR